MFYECSSLSSLPDISNWNTNNVYDMTKMFYECSSLSTLPDISNWNTNNITDMREMFYDCFSLSYVIDSSEIERTKSLSSLGGIFKKIFIKTLKGKTIFIICLNYDTIKSIKNIIKDNIGIQADRQLLFFNENLLDDSKTLRDYNIEANSTFHLVLKKN